MNFHNQAQVLFLLMLLRQLGEGKLIWFLRASLDSAQSLVPAVGRAV